MRLLCSFKIKHYIWAKYYILLWNHYLCVFRLLCENNPISTCQTFAFPTLKSAPKYLFNRFQFKKILAQNCPSIQLECQKIIKLMRKKSNNVCLSFGNYLHFCVKMMWVYRIRSIWNHFVTVLLWPQHRLVIKMLILIDRRISEDDTQPLLAVKPQ